MTMISLKIERLGYNLYLVSVSSDFPFQVLDTDFLPSFFVIIKPFSLGEINRSELCPRLQTSCKPLSL
jgi:hypothetical protein